VAINKFYFQLGDEKYSVKERSDFLFETYYITEYVSKLVKKEKLAYEKANKVLIYLEEDKSGIDYSEMFKSVCVNIKDEYLPPSVHNQSERVDWVLGKLRKAGELLNKSIPKISASIESSLKLFEGDSYRNIWNFHSRTIKPLGKIQLECELNKDNFILNFVVLDKGRELYRKEILKELPDSLCYHHKFNKLKVENDVISVPDRANYSPSTLFSISINDLIREIGEKST